MNGLFEQRAQLHAIAERLADLYPDHASIRRVLAAAHIPIVRILFQSSINTWFYAVVEAHRQQRIIPLLEVALSEYPYDLMLNAIYNTLIQEGDPRP